MNITVLCVGKLKDQALRGPIEEYVRRIKPPLKIVFIEVQEEKLGTQTDDEARGKEAGRLFVRWPERSLVVALDQSGKMLDSPGFAGMIQEVQSRGRDLAFIIGGPVGLDQSVLRRADRVLSLSALTFPHQLVRLILLEQIYRGITILRGEPYHK